MARNMKYAQTKDGQQYQVFEPAIVGEAPCPGEAHSNPYIDHCLTCAPRWGFVPTYGTVDVLAETTRGLAVRVVDAKDEFFERVGGVAGERPPVRLVSLTEKGRGCTMNYLAYVAVDG